MSHTHTQPPAEWPGDHPHIISKDQLAKSQVTGAPVDIAAVLESLAADLDRARAAGDGPRVDKLIRSLIAMGVSPATRDDAGGPTTYPAGGAGGGMP